MSSSDKKAHKASKRKNSFKGGTKPHISRSNSNPEYKPPEDVDPIPEIGILNWGPGTNYPEWKKRFYVWAARSYGNLGNSLEADEEYIPPEIIIDENELTAEADPFHLKLEVIKAQIKNRESEIQSIKERKPQLYAAIWGQLSRESRDQAKRHDFWEVVDQSKEPLHLWRIVEETHMNETSSNPTLDRQNAKIKFERTWQYKAESITDFKDRFDYLYEHYIAMGNPELDDQSLAMDFLMKLDNSRYTEFRNYLMNGVTTGTVAYPNTLSGMYNQAVNFKPIGSSSLSGAVALNPQHRAVFYTGRGDGRGRGNPNWRGTRGGRGGRHEGGRGPPRGGKNNNQSSSSSSAAPTNDEEDEAKGTSSGTNSSRRKSFTGKCMLCQEEGHMMIDCPSLDTAIAAVKQSSSSSKKRTASVTYADESGSGQPGQGRIRLANNFCTCVYRHERISQAIAGGELRLKRYDVILDSGATEGIFHAKELLGNIRTGEFTVHIEGVGGEAMTTDKVGDVSFFGTHLYHPDAIANILPLCLVEDMYDVEYTQGRGFTVYVDGDMGIFFKRIDKGLFVADFSPFLSQDEDNEMQYQGVDDEIIATMTAEGNERLFPPREVKSAQEARAIKRKLGYPADSSMIDAIKYGAINNLPVTEHDIHRANKIYGPDIASLKGKTKARKPAVARAEYTRTPVEIVQTMHSDIMFVDKMAFFTSVLLPLDLTMVNPLHGSSKSTASIRKALSDQLSTVKAHQYRVSTIFSDGEGAIGKLTQEIEAQGVKVNTTGAGQHVPIIEAKIRVIKERVRAHLGVLPFRLARFLLPFLVLFCVSRINIMPSAVRGDRLSPREAFTGRKVNFKRDVTIGFGDYAQVHEVSNIGTNTRNNMEPRTVGGIALLQRMNLQGTVKFYSLQSHKYINRDHWTPLPMPNEVIEHMNKLADRSKRGSVPLDPAFTLGEDNSSIDNPTSQEAAPEPDLIPPMRFMENIIHVDEEPPDEEPVLDDAQPTIAASDESTNHSVVPQPIDEAATTDSGVESLPVRETIENDADTRPKRASAIAARQLVQDNIRARILPYKTAYACNMSMARALSKFKRTALEAIIKELSQLENKGVWKPCDTSTWSRRKLKGVIRSNLFLKEKYLSTGEFDKLKARLVAMGNFQDKGLYDYHSELSSPTVATTSAFMVAAIAAKEKRHVATIDIGGAYLNAEMQNEVFMSLDPKIAAIIANINPSYRNYMRADGTVVVQLQKALYGCVESARLWYEHFAGTLETLGFVKNPVDKCIFNKLINNVQCTICVHVDDCLISCEDQESLEEVLQQLIEVYKEVSVTRGVKHSYLGMTLDFSKEHEVQITMEKYIDEMLKLYEVEGTVSTPATLHLFDVRESPLLSDAMREEFHSRVAKLLYLAKRVRPDILTSCIFLATRVQCATEDDWRKLDRVLRYVNGTRELGIVLRPNPDQPIQLRASVDASYGVHADGKSHTGLVIFLGEGPIFVRSSKQKIVVKSSTEAELVGLSDSLTQILWSREFLIHQGYDVGEAIVYQDNQSTMLLAENGYSSAERSRHIKIRYFWIKDRISTGEVKLEYCKSGDMVADILTKPLQGEAFLRQRATLLNWHF